MIQLNLLPDVKLEYLRSTRQKRLVISISLLVIAISVAVILLLVGVVYVLQRNNLNDLNGDIKTFNNQLKNEKDLDKVLTVQNQLNSLPGLHEQKPDVLRLFGFMTQVTPTAASISQFDANFTDSTMTITGSANTLDVANTFIDTLKFTTYLRGEDSVTTPPKAFSNVVLSQFTRSPTAANYTITLKFDPVIFEGGDAVRLTVPRIISTRSTTEQPTDLFQTPGQTSGQTPKPTSNSAPATGNTRQ